jgi:hypothetical protein
VNKLRIGHIDPATVNDPARIEQFARSAHDAAARPERCD